MSTSGNILRQGSFQVEIKGILNPFSFKSENKNGLFSLELPRGAFEFLVTSRDYKANQILIYTSCQPKEYTFSI